MTSEQRNECVSEAQSMIWLTVINTGLVTSWCAVIAAHGATWYHVGFLIIQSIGLILCVGSLFHRLEKLRAS